MKKLSKITTPTQTILFASLITLSACSQVSTSVELSSGMVNASNFTLTRSYGAV